MKIIKEVASTSTSSLYSFVNTAEDKKKKMKIDVKYSCIYYPGRSPKLVFIIICPRCQSPETYPNNERSAMTFSPTVTWGTAETSAVSFVHFLRPDLLEPKQVEKLQLLSLTSDITGVTAVLKTKEGHG